MAREDVDELLGVCPSSARNYLNDLLKAGIAQRALFGESEFMRTGAQVYRITDDSARVAAYIGGGPIPAGPSFAAALRDPGRHFHFAMDDTPFHIKAHRGPVRADPMALPVAFFRVSEGARV